MSNIINPYIVGNPITAAGSEMFFGREDTITSICQNLIGQYGDHVVVLYGQRRTGKTSILYQLSARLEPHYLCIMVDIHNFALEGISGFLWELANHMVQRLRRDHQVTIPRPLHTEFMSGPRSYFENEFLDQVWSAVGDRHILLMFDEAIHLQEQIQAGKLEPGVFEYLRYLMQHCRQLNFLFSLGSGLEEMKKEYAFLFNVALYKKISFLDERAAADLITQPIKDYYHVEPAAVERIIQITSGHPYHTQLLCHCLFQRWQQQHLSHIEAQDVDGILNEAVELGLSVLKFIWEDSTPAEKAIMASMAAATHDQSSSVGDTNISRVWKHSNVTIPKGEMAKAVQSLIAREVIIGQDKYMFTVDLQRLWVQKYRRLAWVKEEIADTIQEWSKTKSLSRRTVLLGSATVGLAVIGGTALTWWTLTPRFPSNLLYIYHGHTNNVVGVAWSPDGSRIASASYDHTVQVWDAVNGDHVFIYAGHNKKNVTCVAWSPDGTRIASGSDDHTVQVWDAANGGHVYTYRGHIDDVHSVAWSLYGTRIASGSNDRTVQVWQAQNGSNALIHHDPIWVWTAAWSPDDTRIASGTSDSAVRVWDAQDGHLLVTYPLHSSSVHSVAWSPDGTRIVSGSDDNSVQVWNARNGKHFLDYKGHTDKVWTVAWSPDGTRVASGGLDSTVQVWDARNGSTLLIYRAHSGGVGSVRWSPDGTRIASASWDHTVHVWDAP